MTSRTARRIVDAAFLVSATLVVGGVLLNLGRRLSGQDRADWVFLAVTVIGAAIYLLIGRAIVTRQPANAIGWLLIAIPTLALFAMSNGSYGTRAVITAPGSLPFGLASVWVDRWILVPTLASFVPLFLLFPDGRLPSRRWRVVGALTVAAPLLTATAFAVTPGRLTGAMSNLESAHITNPLGLPRFAGAIDVLTQLGGFLILLTAIAAVAAIIVRYRGAGPDDRQQIRWLAFVGVAFFVEFGVAMIGSAIGGERAGELAGFVLFMMMFVTLVVGIPVACGVAILKHRLYQLDVVVRKSLVFAALVGFVGLAYAAIVGVAGLLVETRSSTVPSFLAAVVLAILFQPARDRARRLADHLVYGRRATPYEVLADFSARMSETFATEDVLPRIARILAEGTGADRATVWLRVGAELRPEGSWPPEHRRGPATIAGTSLPELGEPAFEVRHRGDLLGALSVAMPPSDPIDPAKEHLIRDLAAQAGLVLGNVRLIEELRASRQRLVAAQDEERRRLERNLHDGAQQQLVALQVQLRLAEQMTGRDPDKERELLRRLQTASNEALEDLRDLARGIYPPLLADRGLAAALEAQARRSPLPVSIEPDDVGRYPREIESAVYFCVLEALNNVAKYAGATRVEIRLGRSIDAVTFTVRDDGRGFDPDVTGTGTGLQGMADRLDAVGGSLDVVSAPGAGTSVTGTVPHAAGDASPAPADRRRALHAATT